MADKRRQDRVPERVPCAIELVEPWSDHWRAHARLLDGRHERLCNHAHTSFESAMRCARDKIRAGIHGDIIDESGPTRGYHLRAVESWQATREVS